MSSRAALSALHNPRSALVCLVAALAAVAGLVQPAAAAPPPPASVASVDTSRCDDPKPPSWFYPHLERAAERPNDRVPSSWGDSKAMAKIVCWESSFRTGAYNPALPTYGLGQMTRANIDAANVSFDCYWRDGCPNRDRAYWQLVAAMRYADARYGSPAEGWQHIRSHGWW